MKLLLTSWAPHMSEKLEKAFLDLLTKPTNENKVFILAIDTTSQLHQEHLEIAKRWYKQLGFTENNIAIYNRITDKIPCFKDLDIMHMWGGNTFHYMKQIREIGLMQEIRDFVERDEVYIGSSAGSMIMCPDIDVEYWSTDVNDIG